MKIGAIDIGSNSVRLMMWADGKTLYKTINTTRLGQGISSSPYLMEEAIERSAIAVAQFVARVKDEGAQKVYAFATAAVRSAKNANVFVQRVKELCGIDVDVISGTQEAAIGIYGALSGKDGGIIDVGGASTEITLQRGGKCLYSHSANIGTVRLYDMAGRSLSALETVVKKAVGEYGHVNADGLTIYAIGGTATTIASVHLGLKEYDPKIIDGTVVPKESIKNMAQKFSSMTVEEVKGVLGMDVRRADVIGGGCVLMYEILNMLNKDSITVSERDNLEGYVMMKVGYEK
jgi:exopolyphosphatase/guanosine-5'-triphosphate,3'-diphosphate pyrophosphatase